MDITKLLQWKRLPFMVLLLGTMSCSKIVEDLNTNPNEATSATAEYVFKGAQIATMAAQEGMASRLTFVWNSYGRGIALQFGNWGLYQITAFHFDGDWNLYYTGANKNLLIAIEKAQELENFRMVGAAMVLRALAIGSASELWGDVPFTETSDPSTYPNPRFESQHEIFATLQTLLDQAIDHLRNGPGSLGEEDLFFQGDTNKWIEVAYTLKSRFYMNTKEYEEAYQAAQQGVSSFGNSLYTPHGTTVNGNQNMMFSFLTSVRTGSITGEETYNAQLLDPGHERYRGNVKTNETARFGFYYLQDGVNAPGVIEPNTLTTGAKRGFFAEDASFPLVTFQENILTLAETALRSGKGVSTALEHLNEYRAFLNEGSYLDPTYLEPGTYAYLPYELADFAPGGMENRDGLSESDALLREILEERYVSFYGQHLGWNDERRNRGTISGIQLTPTNGTRLPSRFIYSQNELNSNTNSPAEAPSLFDVMEIYRPQ